MTLDLLWCLVLNSQDYRTSPRFLNFTNRANCPPVSVCDFRYKRINCASP